MSNRMHGECDSVLYSDFPHQLGYVRLDRALPDAQWGADFLIRSPLYGIRGGKLGLVFAFSENRTKMDSMILHRRTSLS